MKTFMIQAASHSYGGHKFWAEKVQAETELAARATFHNKYGVVGWIRSIYEVTK